MKINIAMSKNAHSLQRGGKGETESRRRGVAGDKFLGKEVRGNEQREKGQGSKPRGGDIARLSNTSSQF